MAIVSSGSTITLGVFSDTHYWFNGLNFEGESLQLQGHSQELFETLVKELTSANLDLLLHLGDMTSGGGTFNMPYHAFRETLQQTAQRFQSLGIEVHALPGNHDCLLGSSWVHFEQKWALQRGMGKTIDLDHARLILLNAQGHSEQQIYDALPADPVYGWISEEELARLEEALATAQDRPVILFVHQLLKPWGQDKPWKDFYAVLNSQQVIDLMIKYGNVRAVFQGHAHRFDVQNVTVGNSESTFVVLPSLIEYPLGWLRLSLAAEKIEVALRTLPLERLSEQSRKSGNGQEWRGGRPEWHNFSIPLRFTQAQ